MKRLALFLIIFVVAPAYAAALQLDGKFTQGGLVIGRTAPGATVAFEGQAIRVSSEGVFVIGFTRDAPLEARLVVRTPDGKTQEKTLSIEPRSYDIQRIEGLPPRMVTPPPEVLERIRRENAMIYEARHRDTPETHFLNGWIWPVVGRITGVYGSQRILNNEPRQPHYGIDIAAPPGTPVVAPADGIVTLVHRDMYFTGGTIILDHGHGLSSAFLHMQDVEVELHQRVRKGERIGTVGATGRATGPHLDWRINLFDARIDPALLVPPMPPTPGQ